MLVSNAYSTDSRQPWARNLNAKVRPSEQEGRTLNPLGHFQGVCMSCTVVSGSLVPIDQYSLSKLTLA